MPEGFEDAKPWHPRCCEVPMWLIEVRRLGVFLSTFSSARSARSGLEPARESRCLALYAR